MMRLLAPLGLIAMIASHGIARAESATGPHLDAVLPAIAYPGAHGQIEFVLDGRNFADEPEKNVILVAGTALMLGSADECAAALASGVYAKPCVLVDPRTARRQLHVIGVPSARYRSPIAVRLRVDGFEDSNEVSLVFARVPASAPLVGASTVSSLIFLVVLGLVWGGVDGHKIQGRRYGPLTALFLDKETNSYSLSKFQVLLWTAVFVFAYVYFFLCRLLVQWKFELPSVPDGLPTMLAISAGTAVAAAGVTGSRGSKGSGPIYPSMADFVSTGGLVVGERFQFFVWTLVGAFGFVSTLVLVDPSALTELPKIPDNFLYLMGVSSAGYLGGKLTRKPGPVIKALAVVTTKPFVLRVEGDSLADNATVSIDGTLLRQDQYQIAVRERPPQPVDPTFCNDLDLTLLSADAYFEGAHTLALINRDAQSAAVTFPVDPLSIESVSGLVAGATPVSVTITGKNFVGRLTVTWTDASGTATSTPVTPAGATTLTVSLTPGTARGQGRITVESALGLRAAATVTI